MKNALTSAIHVTAPYANKYGPMITLATSALVISSNLLSKKS